MDLSSGTITTMATTIVLLPLAMGLLLIFFGKKLPRGGDWLATIGIGAGAVMSLILFWVFIVQQGDPGWEFSSADHGLSFRWLTLPGLDLRVGVMLDNMTVIMLTMVTVVSTCIFFFSQGYMRGDRDYSRFFAYLSYFCFAMLGLVVSDNLLFLFIFWELVGVGSYLLIGFFYDQEEPPRASIKAFMVNRVGDVLFLLGIILAWQLFGTLRYTEMFAALSAGEFAPAAERAFSSLSNHTVLTISGVLIFCGAISKSAQVPLHTWLPDAMAGPTPVSALIHAATMVAAGVFMVGRMYPYFTPEVLSVIAIVGAITALLGATMGLVAWDIKKVLAYSTMSQLGYMMLALGVGGMVAGLFHLITHAFFKACLFLGSGSVIHAVHSQDMRDMGGLRKKLPVTYWTFLIATLALAGVPMFAGYYSKDQIIANALAFGLTHGVAGWTPFIFGAVGAFMTTFYMLRLIFLTFHGAPADQKRYDQAHESPPVMVLPLVVLATVALFGGGTNNPLPHTEDLWFNRIVEQPVSAAEIGLGLTSEREHFEHVLHTNAHYPALIISVLAILLGWWLARAMYLKKSIDPARVAKRFGPLYTAATRRWYFDDMYDRGIVANLHRLNRLLSRFDKLVIDGLVNLVPLLIRLVAFIAGLFDKLIIDGAVNAFRGVTRALSGVFRLLQTGNAQTYLTWTLLSVVILSIFLARGT